VPIALLAPMTGLRTIGGARLKIAPAAPVAESLSRISAPTAMMAFLAIVRSRSRPAKADLTPVIGASKAIGTVLSGAHNQLDKDSQRRRDDVSFDTVPVFWNHANYLTEI